MKSKAKRHGAPYDIVIVKWEDSRQPVSAWDWVDHYENPSVVRCISVGYLIAETTDVIALAQNLGDLDHDRRQASGVVRIPVLCIRSMVKVH